MRLSITLFVALFCFNTAAQAKEIIVEVRFKNLTAEPLRSGLLSVPESNITIELDKQAPFQFTLPKKGKYIFLFKAEAFKVSVYYPDKITNKRNIVTIVLEEKTKPQEPVQSFPMEPNETVKKEEMLKAFNEGRLNFILHGLNDSTPDWAQAFKQKYGVGIVVENCMIDPLSFQRTVRNNQMILELLEEKYGKDWRQDLPVKPFGIMGTQK